MTAPLATAGEQAASMPQEFRGFFENLRAGRIAMPGCRACGELHWYPMKRCPHCYSADLDWRTLEGAATLWSWTSVRRGFSEGFRDKVPYIVGLVEFAGAPGIRLITNIVEAGEDDLALGMALEPVFSGQNEDIPLVVFRPSAGSVAP